MLFPGIQTPCPPQCTTNSPDKQLAWAAPHSSCSFLHQDTGTEWSERAASRKSPPKGKDFFWSGVSVAWRCPRPRARYPHLDGHLVGSPQPALGYMHLDGHSTSVLRPLLGHAKRPIWTLPQSVNIHEQQGLKSFILQTKTNQILEEGNLPFSSFRPESNAIYLGMDHRSTGKFTDHLL